MDSITTAWLAELVVITYRSAKQSAVGKGVDRPIAHLPMPSEFVATFVVFGGLSLIPGRGQTAATYVAWGLVVATVLNLWDPTTIGNKGGVAVKGGPSTKDQPGAPAIAPPTAAAQQGAS